MIREDYSFTPGPAGQGMIYFQNPIDFTKLGAIFNLSIGNTIYNPGDPLQGATVSGNILYLEMDTSAMLGTDTLQIFYSDVGNPTQVEDVTQLDGVTAIEFLKSIFDELKVLNWQIHLLRTEKKKSYDTPDVIRKAVQKNELL